MPDYDESRHTPPAPVALVTIRHPGLEDALPDVPLLIDSGADVTLLPRVALAAIGLVGTGESYQLIAFDGTTSESEVVRADLVFLNRRFRGRYLVIGGDLGVLGRDVLNHIRLLLDGPSRRWDELPAGAKGG